MKIYKTVGHDEWSITCTAEELLLLIPHSIDIRNAFMEWSKLQPDKENKK